MCQKPVGGKFEFLRYQEKCLGNVNLIIKDQINNIFNKMPLIYS